jgi:hypothetical protein
MNKGLTMNLLFYSRSCKTCEALIKLLQTENLLQHFYLICVDDKLSNLPKQINHVPTMIVKEQNKPLVAEETFEWIKKVKFLRQNMSNIRNKMIQNNVFSKLNKSKVKGFSDIEMGFDSDIFAFSKSDAPALPQSFFGYKDESNNTIFTGPEQKKKISSDDQKKMLSDLQTKRHTQDKNYKTTAKKKQLEAIINTEQQRIVDSYKHNMNNQNQINSIQTLTDQQMEKMKRMQMMQNHIKQMQQLNHFRGGK